MRHILILGAAYGLLPGAKLSLAGHAVTLVGRPGEIEVMGQRPLEVLLSPRRGVEDIVLTVPVAAQASAGQIALAAPQDVDPTRHDLVILAMQEPQYRDGTVAALMRRIANSGRPCLSIMNLAPPPFLTRLGIDVDALEGAYHSSAVWAAFDPRKVSLASPDPQAIRPDPTVPGRLHCTLPSNFKAAPFELPHDQALLQELAADMSHLKISIGDRAVRPPVALIASPSLFVPLAKWPMLIAGNCRCVLSDGIRTIAEAVLSDIHSSAAVFEQVRQLTLSLGAREQDLVTFEEYAKIAPRLTRPSSLARAIEAGLTNVERADRLIIGLLAKQALAGDLIAPIVRLIDIRLARNINLIPIG